MIYEQASAGAGGGESAVDDTRVEERCRNKILFKEDTRGGKEGKKKKKGSCLSVYWIPHITSTQL